MNAVAKAAGWVKGELLDILPVTIFFLIGLHLIVFTKHLVLREQGIVYDGFWAATIGALLVAKVVLVVDKVPFMRRYSGRPLYRPILYRATVYTVAVFAVRLLEVLMREMFQTGGLASGFAAARQEVDWAQFTFVQVWVFVLFLVFVTFVELDNQLPEGGLSKLLFSRRET